MGAWRQSLSNIGFSTSTITANIFRGFHEKNWTTNYNALFYRRYVDDIFCVFNNETDAVAFCLLIRKKKRKQDERVLLRSYKRRTEADSIGPPPNTNNPPTDSPSALHTNSTTGHAHEAESTLREVQDIGSSCSSLQGGEKRMQRHKKVPREVSDDVSNLKSLNSASENPPIRQKEHRRQSPPTSEEHGGASIGMHDVTKNSVQGSEGEEIHVNKGYEDEEKRNGDTTRTSDVDSAV